MISCQNATSGTILTGDLSNVFKSVMYAAPMADVPDTSSAQTGMMRSASFVGFFTLISRILGLVRDGVVAALFPKAQTDAFYVAFTIPNIFRQLLAEGALHAAFVPIFTEYRHQHDPHQTRKMVANCLGALTLVLFVVSAAGSLLAPWVVKLFAMGFADDTAKFNLTITLTQIMFWFLFFVGLTALAMGVLNSMRHFGAPAIAPAVLNIVIISAVLLLLPVAQAFDWPPISALAIAIVLGGAAQLALQLPFLAKQHFLLWPRFDVSHPAVRRVAKLMAPSIVGLAIYQLNIIVSRQIASYMPEGTVSYIYYAQRLIEFPLGIVAVAIATVSMPRFSALVTEGKLEELKRTYAYSIKLGLFVMLPAVAGLISLRLPITAMLFQRGVFSHFMAQQTALTLMGFTVGMWAAGSVRQTVPVFYALQDTTTPVKVGALSFVSFVGAALLLRRPLGVFGLALSVSLSSTVNFALLLFFLRRKIGRLGLVRIGQSVWRSTAAAIACGLAASTVARLGDWSLGGLRAFNYIILLGAVAAGIIAFVVVARVIRSEELLRLLKR